MIFLVLALAAAPALGAEQQYKTEKADVVVEEVTAGLEHPWSLAFLPDGRMLVTERPGRLRLVDVRPSARSPLLPPIRNVPRVHARGQGGLLDVALDPRFTENRLIYLSYAEARDGSRNGTTVARARLSADFDALEDVTVIFRQEPSYSSSAHFGSRLVFARDGTLFITLGDRFSARDEAQNLANHLGKIVRIDTSGKPPKDNPFLSQSNARPEIWSYGHRNVQGAALHPVTGKLWISEHGPRGGDEINIPEAGRNYGWPVIGYGIDYSGAKIHESTRKAGMEQPIHHWTPSIAPSGLAFYTGDRFPAWRGNAFAGALAGQLLARLELDGERVVHEERMLQGLRARIRDVRQGPDGYLYLLTDESDGRLLRVRPPE
ncbi:MAG: PQQ-dependent sugar dehydrogenase [Hyphomicrobiaceae bacterium]|nr:MAG: PQQ-dependent sugar dehydrogenase [Hyphomicrobiaceae bacterium]